MQVRVAPFRIIAVDPSLTACAIVVLEFRDAIRVIDKEVIETQAEARMDARLRCLMNECTRAYKRHSNGAYEFARRTYGVVESPPQGARMHNSATMAKVAGACEMGLGKCNKLEAYTATAAKRHLVPGWHGWSKANWEKAGYKKKFRKSQPSKSSVASHLATKYGINLANPDMSDAAALGVYMAHKNKWIKGTL